MSSFTKYIQKMNTNGWGIIDLQNELTRLIKEYNKIKGTYLLIYTAAMGKHIPGIELEQPDFYLIRDLLDENRGLKNIDIYIETPGGSGEAAEEIVKWIRKNFDNVTFLTAGEAKSAGTIIALSADEILMGETSSLGPIDAQIKVGRSIVSAHDYKLWIDKKREEVEDGSKLNPVDVGIISQISPGEIYMAENSLRFAEDLVKEWLVKYKFKNWNNTETRNVTVTEEMKQERAREIAEKLTNHSVWRTHGRSLKIEDLENLGLKINNFDEDENIKELIYSIHSVIRLIFETSTIFKIIATEANRIERNAAPANSPRNEFLDIPSLINVDVKCQKCGRDHKLYCKLINDPNLDNDMKQKNIKKFPDNAKYKCECGFEVDLLGIKNEIESKFKKKII